MDPAICIQQWTTAVAGLYRDCDLDEGLVFNVAQAGDNTADDTELESLGVTHRDDVSALLDACRLGEGQRGKSLRVDFQDGKVEGAVPGMDCGDFMLGSILKAYAHRSGFADDVRAGSDQSVL